MHVKPDLRQRFLQAIEVDALGSEKDEPGCLRFNVLQDSRDENTYYFYEVYKDEAAIEAHRAMPHYAVWRDVADVLDGPAEAIPCDPFFPRTAPTGASSNAHPSCELRGQQLRQDHPMAVRRGWDAFVA